MRDPAENGPARRRVTLALVAALAAAAGACDGCKRGDRLVPFKADAGPAGAAADDDAPADDGDAQAPFTPREGHVFDEGTRKVAVEGAPLAVDKGAVRALLPEDLTGDGARDALAVVAFEGGGARLVFAPRRGATFDAPVVLGALFDDRAGCTVEAASLRWPTPGAAVAVATRRCPPPTGAADPKAAASAGDGPAETALALVAVGDGAPRLAARLRAAAPTPGAGSDDPTRATAWHVAAEALEGEADGQAGVDDTPAGIAVVVRATVPGREGEAALRLPWRTTPGGLRRDPTEPEASLAALAEAAREALGDRPARAAADARAALALHALVCREAGEARIAVGDAAGLPCGRSAAAGQAAAVLAAALAAQGEAFAALEQAARLDRPGRAVTDRERRLVEDALARMPADESGAVRDGPEVETLARPPVHRSRLAFLDEGRLLVRGETPVVLDVRTGAPITPTPELPPRWLASTVTDPAGRFAVTAVERRCEGQALAIVPAADVVAGVVVGRPAAHPMLAPRPPPPGCPGGPLAANVRGDADGWRVLGWPPQGVLAARGERLRVVPLTADGAPAGDALDVPSGTPPPAPLVPGAVTADGTRHAVGTRWGLLVHRVAPTPGLTVRRPAGWDVAAPAPDDVAVSPSGARLAWIRGGRVRLLGPEPAEDPDGDAAPDPAR